MIGRRELIGTMTATALGGAMTAATAQPTAAPSRGLKIGQAARWVAIGDSITDAGRARPIGEGPGGLGTGYVQTMDALLQAWYPARRIRLFNVGTSGHNVRDLAARWQTDVTDLKPEWLSIMIGANDVWRQFDRVTQPERAVLPDEYERVYDQLLTSTAPTLTGGLILITPFFLELRTNDPMRARMDEYGAIVKRLAAKHRAILVDSQAAFDVVLKDLPSAMINWDRVHLNHIGSAVLARAVLNAVGFEW
jgi:lysophospholipase L1-like esterase